MVKYAALALITSLAALMLRPYGKAYAAAVGTVGLILLVSAAVSAWASLEEGFGQLLSLGREAKVSLETVVRLTGTALITQTACSVCTQSGEEEVAKACALVGKALMLAMTVPVLWEYLHWLYLLFSSV